MPDAPQMPGRAAKGALLVALFSVFLDILAFGVIIPIQPFYAEEFGASEAVVTLLGASFSFMQFLFAPMWGRLSDRIGRRPVMLVSIAFATVGHVIMATATSLSVLFAARIIVGFGTSNFGAAQAIVADTTSGAMRSRGMGLFGAAFGVGFVLGPAIGGALVQFDVTTPMWFSALLSLINLLFAFRYLPETHPLERRTGTRERHWFPLAGLSRARLFPNVGLLLCVMAFAITAQGLSEQVLSLLIERTWVLPDHGGILTSETQRQAAALTAVCLIAVGITAIVVQGGLLGRLQKRFGERVLIRSGAGLAALGIVGFPLTALSGSFALLLVASVFFAAGVGLIAPSTSGLLSRAVPPEEQGRWLGTGQSLGALGRAVGPALSGFLFASGRGLPFILGALLMLGTLFFSTRLQDSRSHS